MESAALTVVRRPWPGILLASTAVAVLAGVDLAGDFGSGTSSAHVILEGTLLAMGIAGVCFAVVQWRKAIHEVARAEARATELSLSLAASRADADRWQKETRQLLRGLGVAIDLQFERWALTASEKEVGLLLLKGLSHREVGEARQVSEATARQQAAAVYRKSGLGGRNELSAFFLEDLLLPAPTAGPVR